MKINVMFARREKGLESEVKKSRSKSPSYSPAR